MGNLKKGALTVEELVRSERHWISVSQEDSFTTQISTLKKKQALPRKDILTGEWLDANGLQIFNTNSVYIRSCRFENNTVSTFPNIGGGGAFIEDSHVVFSGHNEFVNNFVSKELFAGGGLQLLNSSA